MLEPTETAAELRSQIAECEAKLKSLKERLTAHEPNPATSAKPGTATPDWKWPLEGEEYERYGRQLILPAVGIQGQLRLKAARVLIVGAGGLGCPAAAYLAGAGVGTIGVVDGDVVEVSNLHRQIAHGTSRVGMLKVDSAIGYLKELNPLPTYNPYRTHLTPQNAESIVSNYDLVLDCTDHPTSRYLISDICVLLRKPLVSASALRTDGQLIVLNTPPAAQGDVTGGPCYRCVFPRPPPPDAVTSCGEGGILGPIVGVMGVLQALEAVRIVAAGIHFPVEGAVGLQPSLLLLSTPADGAPAGFRTVRMRGRRKDCVACGVGSTLSLEGMRMGSMDYVLFCGGGRRPVEVLSEGERVSVKELERVLETRDGNRGVCVLDVRERELFDVASIEGAVNVPFSKTLVTASEDGERPGWFPEDVGPDVPIYVVCRVGNDSQIVARRLKELGLDRGGERFIGDVKGGMRAWRDEADGTLPFL